MISGENETSNYTSHTMPFLTQLEIGAMGLSVVCSFLCFITETLGEFSWKMSARWISKLMTKNSVAWNADYVPFLGSDTHFSHGLCRTVKALHSPWLLIF